MSPAIAGLVAGFVLGVTLLVLIQHGIEERRSEGRLETWAVHDADRVVRRGVDRRRASIKRHIGAGLGPEMTTLPFEAADIRFLGHPAHFVVFDGHTQVKDGHVAELAEVVFVMMRPEAEADAALIDECLRAGRVRWSTLRRSGDLLEQNGPGP